MKRKSLCLSSTKWYLFLLELPLIYLFILAILYHNRVDSVFKLFPLEIVIGGLILFFPIYFVRLVLLSADEARTIGVFSTRERSVIRKDKTLVLTLRNRHFFRVELFGRDSDTPALDWLKNDKNYQPEDYCMFRTRAVGTKRTVKKILVFYGADPDFAEKLLTVPGTLNATEDAEFSSLEREAGYTVKIRFLTTVL